MSVPRRRYVALVFVAASACGPGRQEREDRAVVAVATGLEELRLENLEQAERAFLQAVSLMPRDVSGHSNLAVTYLRGGRLTEAEAEARRAWNNDSSVAAVGLVMARVHAAQGRVDDARRILQRFAAPGREDRAALYALAELASDPARRADLLANLVVASPANLAARIQLLGALVASGRLDSAARALEEVRRLPPEPPPEAMTSYAAALRGLREGNAGAARAPLARFTSILELTPDYQASLAAIKGPDGPRVGKPSLAFSPNYLVVERAQRLGRTIRDIVSFTDISGEMRLDATSGAVPAPDGGASAFTAADFDGDDVVDLVTTARDRSSGRRGVRVLRGVGPAFQDVTQRSRVVADAPTHATVADVDNDGHPDLALVDASGGMHLFHNDGKWRFADVTRNAQLGGVSGVRKLLFADLDHDGDLDLLAAGSRGLQAQRNNADGTFVDATAEFGFARTAAASDVAFGDFDADGRLDVVVCGEGSGVSLFRNVGARRFADVSAVSQLAPVTAAAVAVGDYDNDGALDLALVAPDGAVLLRRNRGDATFAADERSVPATAAVRELIPLSAQFADIDNDGWLDLLIAGTPRSAAGRGLALLVSDGAGRLRDRSTLAPASLRTGSGLTVVDLDADGDEDVLVADAADGVRVLRNDRGNANLHVNVRLTGLRTGSGKNNDFGIGARIDVRAGELVQTRVVTGPVTHFGLGPHLKADVIRIEWPNGVPQSIHLPGTDQDVLEREALKSSCGFLYAWDGTRFSFVTDVMWRSALGMPLGIMGSNTSWAPAGSSQEYLRIPGSSLRERDGRYVLQLTEELWETSYTDALHLLALDHPDSVSVAVDERFVPPAPVSLRLYQYAGRAAPRAAVDERGRDVLPALRRQDDVYVADFIPLEYQGLVESHDLVADLGDAAGRPGSILVLRGWIYPTDASINVALSQQARLKPVMPSLEVRDASGRWVRAADLGFPSGKNKTIVIELGGKFPTRDHHVRIRTNLQIYWDEAFVAQEVSGASALLDTLRLESAHLHYRGTSREYRKGGRFGPHWFDYDSVTTQPVWRPISGAFTRFGDVRPLLSAADDQYIVMAPGDETTLRFLAPPPPRAGWTRDFLLYTDGWIKDADMNTAFGNTVDPLPFHGIRTYPYAAGEAYPSDTAHRRYAREYNTRVVPRR